MSNLPGTTSPSASSPPSPFKLDAVLTDTSLDAYLTGILNTILFVRLLGLLEPFEDVPIPQHSFHGIVYPVISDTTLRNPVETGANTPDDDLMNRSPREWTSSKVAALLKTYKEKRHGRRKTQPPVVQDMYTKVILVLKLYNASHHNANNNMESGGRCWEVWIIDLDVLDNTEKNTPIANPIDRTNTTTTTTTTATATTTTNRPKDSERLYDFSSLDTDAKLEAMKSSFHSNMFQIIKFADSNTDSIPSIRTQSLNPFSIRTEFWIKPNLSASTNINSSSNPSGELDLDFNSLNISSITGDSGLSQESIEYINTTENGDVVISSGSGSGSGSKSDYDTNTNRGKDDLWKNGYNFFKKMLE